MVTAIEDNTRSPTRLKISHDRILQAETKPTHEMRQRRKEEEADSTKSNDVSASTQAPCVTYMSQETQEAEETSKVDDQQKEDVSEAYTSDYMKDTAVSALT
jgi:hypothetical protein